jgi:hypothetical protein
MTQTIYTHSLFPKNGEPLTPDFPITKSAYYLEHENAHCGRLLVKPAAVAADVENGYAVVRPTQTRRIADAVQAAFKLS